MTGMKMPVNYAVEMFLDRVAASKVYKGELYKDSDPVEYYLSGKAGDLMHPQTRALLERLLSILASHGEEKTYEYIRKNVLRRKKRQPLFGLRRARVRAWPGSWRPLTPGMAEKPTQDSGDGCR